MWFCEHKSTSFRMVSTSLRSPVTWHAVASWYIMWRVVIAWKPVKCSSDWRQLLLSLCDIQVTKWFAICTLQVNISTSECARLSVNSVAILTSDNVNKPWFTKTIRRSSSVCRRILNALKIEHIISISNRRGQSHWHWSTSNFSPFVDSYFLIQG